jgi:hypothetical protein
MIGCVTDATNVPVAGAVVTLPELSLSTTTDIEGRYEFIVGKLGFFQQRYVKRHTIYHKPDIHNEIRLFAAPKIRPP